VYQKLKGFTSSTGSLSGCTSTGSGFAQPQDIAINPENTLAYIANNATNSVSVCVIDSVTGSLSNCATVGTGFTNPTGIALS